MLFLQSTAAVLRIFIPYRILPPVVPDTLIEPVPVLLPIVFPPAVPTFTFPAVTLRASQTDPVEFLQSIFRIVLFEMLLAAPVLTEILIP